jgi:hypothetical protein
MLTSFNRRRHERFLVPAMYTPVSVRSIDPPAQPGRGLPGHCYDLSEGGLQFELDHPLPLGTAIEIKIQLPASSPTQPLEEREVRVLGHVVWNDQSEPGPVRMAASFARFTNASDRERLFRHITSGRLKRAA